MFSPLLFSIYTNEFTSHHKIFKYTDYTTILGFINKSDETPLPRCVLSCTLVQQQLPLTQCFKNNGNSCRPQDEDKHIFDQPINLMDSFKFLCNYISNTLKWNINTNHIKKAQQRLYYLRQLKKYHLLVALVHFYKAIIESILTSSLTQCVYMMV